MARSWPPGAGRRAVLAGIAWGVPMAILFVAPEVLGCGVLCLSDAAVTLAVTTIGGISTIGLYAARFGGTASGTPRRRNFTQEGKSWLASTS